MGMTCTDMSDVEAMLLARDLVKQLQAKNIWCTITEINEPDLRFVKIEATIKIKREGT
jgi:hypothetical protein